jgi:signal transduction histidine kinase/CheY-like chemotaxis protein
VLIPEALLQKDPPLILVADDSPSEAAVLEKLLAAHGYGVCSARNVDEALRMIQARRPQLLISGAMVPELDRFELCRRVRGLDGLKELPIILLAQLDDPCDLLQSLEAGANYLVSKPYSTPLLLERVASALAAGGGSVAPDPKSIEIVHRHKSYRIAATRDQAIGHLLAACELAAQKNRELQCARERLHNLNRDLEQRVQERAEAVTFESAAQLQAILELRKKDEALIQQSRQAAMGEMIGNIAHQWRQPLNAVGLLVQDLKLSYQYGEFSKEYLDSSAEKMMQIIRHMSQTIDDFRSFFTPQREKSRFELEQVVRKTLTLVEGRLASKGIRVELNSQESPAVLGYPGEFSQVLLNIISNAIDAFNEERCADPCLQVSVFAEGGRSVVAIADNAGGIQEQVMGRIFEPYFTTKEPGKGTGIGLFMAKNIIEKSMSGTLSARNMGAGAEFRIEV